jgi:hypothetical protein
MNEQQDQNRLIVFFEYCRKPWGTVAVFRYASLIAENQDVLYSREDLEIKVKNMKKDRRDFSMEEKVLKDWPL